MSITSACCPGLSRLPHSSQVRHCGCQSKPSDDFRSAKGKNQM